MESFCTTTLAFLLALFWVWTLEESHSLDSLTRRFRYPYPAIFPLIGLSALLASVIGILAGLYPAWHMTSFRNRTGGSTDPSPSRGEPNSSAKGLIGIQYVISSRPDHLCAIHLSADRYIRHVNLGFDKEYLLQVRLSEEMALNDNQRYKQRLLEHPDIVDVAFTQQKFVSDDIKTQPGNHL